MTNTYPDKASRVAATAGSSNRQSPGWDGTACALVAAFPVLSKERVNVAASITPVDVG